MKFNIKCVLYSSLLFRHGKLDYELYVVGLYGGFVSSAIAVKLAALRAFMNDNISLFGVGLSRDRLHKSAAFAGAVARIYIKMLRPQAKGAMVSRGITKRLYLPPAMLADEGVVVFREKLCFHIEFAFLWFVCKF